MKYEDGGSREREDSLRDSNRRGERIGGRCWERETPGVIHQKLSFEIGLQMEAYAREQGRECLVLCHPVRVLLHGDEDAVVEPDLLVLHDLSKLQRDSVCGAPELIAEILTPSSADRDRFLKLMSYMEAGVKEYWIVDPKGRTIMVYEQDAPVIPMTYTFEDEVPVGIWGRACKVDFRRIMERSGFLFEPVLTAGFM